MDPTRFADGRFPGNRRKRVALPAGHLLEALGVTGLPKLPTHDQNDAAVAEILAEATDNHATA
jgi:hypothetical protein